VTSTVCEMTNWGFNAAGEVAQTDRQTQLLEVVSRDGQMDEIK
jgi:hypothetical protein